jgi:YtxH-like protein
VRENLNPIREDNMMKPGSENGTSDRVHEGTGKSKERLGAITRTDTITENKWSNNFSIFAVGVGIGALAGLLFAPASGKRTRKYVIGSVKQSLDDAASTGKRWSRSAQETLVDVKANVVDVVEAGQKAYRTARDA